MGADAVYALRHFLGLGICLVIIRFCCDCVKSRVMFETRLNEDDKKGGGGQYHFWRERVRG